MKLTVFFSFLLFISSYGTSLSQTTRLSLNLKNVAVQNVIKQIEDQTEFNFIYQDEVFQKDQKITIQANQAPIDSVMQLLAEQASVKYRIFDRQIVIMTDKMKESPSVIKSETAVEQKKELSGTVRDNKGIPLPGVTVVVKGTTIGTLTDNDGKFKFSVPADVKVIVFSFIGMKSQKLPITMKTTFNVVMAEEAVAMDDVVVVGFAIQKKESVVGAISQVKGSDLVKSGVPTISNSLTGRVPGMVTVQQTGLPGSDDAKIYIRGISSFSGNNSPLVLVDGIERSMNDIDPTEVESISVLKDASATAVFGVKGANGVILITTKRGKEGKMEISVKFDQTLKKPTFKRQLAGSYETLYDKNIVNRNNQQYSSVLSDDILNHYRVQDMPYIYPDVDLMNLMLRNFGTDTQASISASGGTKDAKYFVSLGYLNEGDLFKGTQTLYDPSYKYSRYNFRINFDFDFTKTTKVSISSGGYVGLDTHSSLSRMMTVIAFNPPYDSPYLYPASLLQQYPDTNWPEVKNRVAGSLINAGQETVYTSYNDAGTKKYNRNKLGTDLVLHQQLDFVTKGLSFQANVSYNSQSYFYGGGYSYLGDYYTLTMLADNKYQWTRYINRAVDNYTILQPPSYNTIYRQGTPYPDKNIDYGAQFDYKSSFKQNNISALALFKRRQTQVGAGFPHYEENWVGRVTYDYDGKYLAEANIGVSGSEQFAPGNRFGYFPAVALGWNIAKEPLVKRVIPKMNNFKLRYSYGESGNDNTGSQWLYISQLNNWTTFQTGDVNSNKTVTTIQEGSLPNVNAQWERSIKNNLGIELGFLDNTYTFTAEFFNEKRQGILMTRRAVSDWLGQTSLPLNIGKTKVHGYEFEVGYNKIINNVQYWAKANFNFFENRIVNQDDPLMTPSYMKTEGMPIGQSKSQYNIGYYQNMDEIANYSLQNSSLKLIGTDKILDFNGDGVLNGNDAVPMGYTPQPNYTYAVSAGLAYKAFDFNFLVQGATNVARNVGSYANPIVNNNIKFSGRDDVWTPDNTDAAYANWGGWNPAQKALSNAYYLRLKSIELGYKMPNQWVKILGLSSARIYFQGANLITYAPNVFIGDPENQASSDVYGNAFVYTGESYPLSRRYTFGIKVDF